MVRCSLVDEVVSEVISGVYGSRPEVVRKLVPGHDHSAELAELRYELQQLPLQGLSRRDEDAERNRLRDLEDELESRESVPDRWEDVPTGRTLGMVWEGLQSHERGSWLASKWFDILPTKESVTFVLSLSDRSGAAVTTVPFED
jgi:Arc/MetJ-type ribon-helix-helix transcriptional regulator